MTIRIKTAIAAAIASCAAGTAMAMPPGTNTAHTVYIGGATAQDQGIDYAVRKVCKAVTSLTTDAATRMDVYRFGTSDRTWTCMTNETLFPGINGGVAGDVSIRIYKFSSGGSTNGVVPLIPPGTTLAYHKETSAVSCTTNDSISTPAGFSNLVDHGTCSGSTAADHVPDFGFSDVEPALINAAAKGKVDGSGANHLIFGIPVSLNLYRALQANQGLDDTSDGYEDMPSLSSEAVAGAFTGKLQVWDQIINKDGDGLAAPGSGDTTVKVCRRGTGSGTQAITEITFLRERCSINSPATMLPADAAGGGTSGTTTLPAFASGNVHAGSGSPDVRNCLDKANTDGYYAIGLLSTECQPENTTASCGSGVKNYRMVKVDGAAPTQVDVVSGRYTYWAEQSINSSTITAGDGLLLKNKMQALLSSVDVLKQINTGFYFSFGQAGLLGVPSVDLGSLPAPPYTELSVQDNPVNSSDKNPGGTGTNNCQVSPAINSSYVVPDIRPILPQGS